MSVVLTKHRVEPKKCLSCEAVLLEFLPGRFRCPDCGYKEDQY